MPTLAPRFILLLGSYDATTKAIMNDLKQGIAEKYHGMGVFVILLDQAEVFEFRKEFEQKLFFGILDGSQEKGTLYLFSHTGTFFESYEISSLRDLDRIIESEDQIKSWTKYTIRDKLEILGRTAPVIFAIREMETTRGGEVAELTYFLLNKDTSKKVTLFKREGFTLSDMVMEFMDAYDGRLRTYLTPDDLPKEVFRVLSYSLK